MLGQIKDRVLTATLGMPSTSSASAKAPRTLRDEPYGKHDVQTYDVYIPAEPNGAVLFLIHGDKWKDGDKSDSPLVDNKVIFWRDLGFTLVSANYRLAPQAEPFVQAEDLALAVAHAQGEAKTWGAESSKFVLMGVGSGGYLVALLNTFPEIANTAGCTPWVGSVVIDCEHLDIPALMNGPHGAEFVDVFGEDPINWERNSPLHCLERQVPPMLLLRSTTSGAGRAATDFAEKATELGSDVNVISEALSHREMSASLGTPGALTDEVNAFIQRVTTTV